MKHFMKTAIAALAIGVAATAAHGAGLKDPKDVKIAFVVHGSAGDPYWSVVKRGVDDAAALTGAQVQYIAPQVFDVVEQARLLEAAVATQPDGIAISLADADAMKGAVEQALAAGIPLINIDSGEKPGEELGVTIYVGTTSEYDSGLRGGRKLAAAGILNVVCLNHEVGNTSLDDRCQGVNDGLKESGGAAEVLAVANDPGDIQRRTEAYIASHPDVQAFFAAGANGADALIPMFREREFFSKYKLYTFDVSLPVLDSIIAGEVGFGMDAQQYLMGFLPVVYLVEHATHGFWIQNNVYTGPLFVETPEQAQALLDLAKEGIR